MPVAEIYWAVFDGASPLCSVSLVLESCLSDPLSGQRATLCMSSTYDWHSMQDLGCGLKALNPHSSEAQGH